MNSNIFKIQFYVFPYIFTFYTPTLKHSCIYFI